MTTPPLDDARLEPHTRQRLDEQVVYPWADVSVRSTPRTFLARGDGVYVWDTDGNRYLDGPGGMWCVNVGHGRAEIADAMAAQATTLGYSSPWSFGSDATLELTRRLVAESPGDLDHVFYTTCGSTAVDSALRFVFFYNNCRGKPDKKQIIARVNGYHGSTFLTGTVSGKTSDKAHMEMVDGLVHHVSEPKPADRRAGQTVEQFCDELVEEFESAIVDIGPDRVAAFIAEPVLGSGGVVVPPADYHRRMLEVCRRHDVLYISDEVVTAFGRLGHLFASEHEFGIVPDLITTAKGLTSGYVPMGAVFISARLFDELRDLRADPTYFTSGFTYSAHPVAVAAASANLDIIEREELIAHVRDVGPYFQQRLGELSDLEPVWDVRGVGLMGAVEVRLPGTAADDARNAAFLATVDRLCQQRGLILRPVYSSCVLSPPLVITRAEIDQLADTLRSALVDAATA